MSTKCLENNLDNYCGIFPPRWKATEQTPSRLAELTIFQILFRELIKVDVVVSSDLSTRITQKWDLVIQPVTCSYMHSHQVTHFHPTLHCLLWVQYMVDSHTNTEAAE